MGSPTRDVEMVTRDLEAGQQSSDSIGHLSASRYERKHRKYSSASNLPGDVRGMKRVGSMSSMSSKRSIRDLRDAVLTARDTKSRKLASFKLGKYPKGEQQLNHSRSFMTQPEKRAALSSKGSGSGKVIDGHHLQREKQRMMKENKMFLIVEKNFHKVAVLSKNLEKHIDSNTVSLKGGMAAAGAAGFRRW